MTTSSVYGLRLCVCGGKILFGMLPFPSVRAAGPLVSATNSAGNATDTPRKTAVIPKARRSGRPKGTTKRSVKQGCVGWNHTGCGAPTMKKRRYCRSCHTPQYHCSIDITTFKFNVLWCNIGSNSQLRERRALAREAAQSVKEAKDQNADQ